MPKLLPALFASAALIGSQAWGGGMSDPPVEPMLEAPMVEDAGSMGSMGSGGWIVPLLLIGVVALIVSQQNDKAAPPEPSDARIKTDIHLVGMAENGLPLYTFKYLWSDATYEGVMAQDVEKFMPEAVVTGLFGVLAVNYDMLGLEMKTLG